MWSGWGRKRERERIRFDVNDAMMHYVNSLCDKPLFKHTFLHLWKSECSMYEMKNRYDVETRQQRSGKKERKCLKYEKWRLRGMGTTGSSDEIIRLPLKFTDLP